MLIINQLIVDGLYESEYMRKHNAQDICEPKCRNRHHLYNSLAENHLMRKFEVLFTVAYFIQGSKNPWYFMKKTTPVEFIKTQV